MLEDKCFGAFVAFRGYLYFQISLDKFNILSAVFRMGVLLSLGDLVWMIL